MDIVGKRYTYFLISLCLIVPGMIGLIIWVVCLAALSLLVSLFKAPLISFGFGPQPATSSRFVRQFWRNGCGAEVVSEWGNGYPHQTSG